MRINIAERDRKKRLQLGPVARKAILLLGGGLSLGLTTRPDMYFKIIKGLTKEWREINQRTLHNTIKKLYQSKLIDYQENDDGTITLILTDDGKNREVRYNLEKMKIKKPKKWDGLWRMVIFDIPEEFKQGRAALTEKFKQLGFFPLQKSVFIFPYECRGEVDFLVEIFDLRPYVRFIIAKKTDVDLDLKNKFSLK